MKSVNFCWHCFLLVKITFYAKSVSFWANEWISKYSDKIMSCKLWGKVTSVSVNINFWCKNVNFVRKELKFGRNVEFFIKCGLLLKVIIFLQNVLIFRKKWLLVWRFIYINKVSNSDKKTILNILKGVFSVFEVSIFGRVVLF